MVALAALPAEHAGLMLRWGMRRYADGMGVPVEEARAESAMDDRAWAVLIQLVRPLLDLEALEAGTIVVQAFARAADNLARVSASKVRAARVIEVVAKRAAGGGTSRPALSVVRADADHDVHRRSPPSPPRDGGPWDAVAGQIVARGAPPMEVEAAIKRWRGVHSVEQVLSALQSTAERRIAKPVKYIDAVLANDVASRRSTMPATIRTATEGAATPRPVKRKVKVGPRPGWTFEGWTAKGHPRGGMTVEERKQVWRDDSGTLSYKSPDPEGDRKIPTYDEDPGVYEAD